MSMRVKVTGLRELDAALGQFSKATGKAVLRRTLIKAGQPIADVMWALAPDDPKTGGYDLKRSIKVGTKLSKRQAAKHRRMFRDDKASAEVFVGPGPLPQAIFQEFGTVNHGPQAFVRPGWDATKHGALGMVKSELAAEIDKTAKRLAARAARR